MSRTITAMYDSRHEAEQARDQLRTSMGVEARILDQSAAGGQSSAGMGGSGMSGSTDMGGSTNRYSDHGGSYSPSGSQNAGESRGFWAELKDIFVSDEDRHSYEEGMRRGGFLLTATVSEDQADRACDLLEQSNGVDFDSREKQWRSEGWSGYQSGNAMGSSSSRSSAMGNSSNASGERSNASEEQHIPIVEEQLRVGKREVSRGGARVRSYVEEVPVNESVTLHEEHVNIERRPVDRKLDAAELKDGSLLRGQTVEMREMAEEAVVGKEARVTEEIVVSKTATDRTEEVHDTVRRTKVDVDEGSTDGDRTRTDQERGAFGFDKNR